MTSKNSKCHFEYPIIFFCRRLINIIFSRSNELDQLREKIKMLEKQNEQLQQQVRAIQDSTLQKYEHALATVFTPGQIKKLLDLEKGKKIRWSPEDIASAISLRSVSPKAYRYLKANNYPLPALSTLRRWASTFDLSPGILKNVTSLLQKKSSDLTDTDRICVLSFDEVYMSNKIDIEKKQERVVGPHTKCQTVMARGLCSHWKEPVYYQFDQPMTKEILEDIISELFKANFIVVAICSDMGTENIGLWSKLNVGHNKNCSFHHPCDSSLKIFVYADVPHLIKLVRNHLLDHGFIVDDFIINKDFFQVLLNISTSELTLAHKLTDHHLSLQGSMRQRVKPAVQVLSNSVAKAIEYAGENGLMPHNSNWKLAANCVQLFNDWFDLLNSRTKLTGNCPTRNAFGTDLENQTKVINQMTEFINSMRVGKHREIIPFQKGMLLSNRSLLEMFDYLKKKYKIEYILTARLNQDVLENLFAYIREMGGANDHPSPLDFTYRLRWYILGKNSAAIFTENRNTLETGESFLLNVLDETRPSTDKSESEDICLTKKMFSNLLNFNEEVVIEPEEELIYSYFVDPDYLEEEIIGEEMISFMQSYEVKENISLESLKYIAGYVAFKFKDKYTLGVPTEKLDSSKTPGWLETISKGSLLHPNEDLWQVAQTMEKEFHKMHGNSLAKGKQIFQALAKRTLEQLKNKSVPFEVILCLSRTRTYIRLRDLNRKISFKNCQRKLDKKMSKFTNFKK